MIDESIFALIEKDVFGFEQVSRFPGVSLTENIQSMLSREKANPGIKITEEDGMLTVNLEIIVYFGANIPQLCYDIQTRVKHDVEQSLDMIVKAVNIKVEGIDEPSKQPS